MGHENRRAWMSVMGIELLDDHDVGLELFQDFDEPLMQLSQPLGHRLGLTTNDACFEYAGSSPAYFKQGVAGDAEPGINAQDAW